MFLAEKLKNRHVSAFFLSIRQIISGISVKFRSNFIEIEWRTVEIWENIRSFWEKKTEKINFYKNLKLSGAKECQFCRPWKCCKMSIYLQRSVLIQRRTSDLIFIILVASRDLILTERSYPEVWLEGALDDKLKLERLAALANRALQLPKRSMLSYGADRNEKLAANWLVCSRRPPKWIP